MPICPQCESSRVVCRDRAKKVGSALGALTGTAWGAVRAMRGVRLGGPEDTGKGPTGSLLSSMVGAALTGLAGGATIGQAVDANLLDNHACIACGWTFTSASAHTVVERPGGSAKETP